MHAGARAQPVDEGGLPQPVDAARHQVVHQVVAVGDGVEDLPDKARLLVVTHFAEAEMGGVARTAAGAPGHAGDDSPAGRSEEHTSELQSLMRISYAVFCLKK